MQKQLSSSFKLIAIFILVSYFSSCGSKKVEGAESIEVKPQTTKVEGYLGEFLEVSEGTYKAESDKNPIVPSWVVKVKMKVKSSYTKDDFGLHDGSNGPLYLDFYDKEGAPLTGLDHLSSEYTSDTKIADLLKAGSGETWVTFKKFAENGAKKFPTNTSAFTISSEKQEKTSSNANDNNSSSSSNESAELSSADIDKMLDDFDEYVTQYVVLYKKSKEGDQNAMTEYPAFLEKANNLTESMKNAQKEKKMTASQLSRMVKIEGKMMQGMSNQ